MPKRTQASWREYKEYTMRAVIARADERCEVMLDRNGEACSGLPKVRRCGWVIPFDKARPINFLHRSTRNGESQEWVNNPDNIIYGCEEHHIEESKTGKHVEICVYEEGELNYIPDEQ